MYLNTLSEAIKNTADFQFEISKNYALNQGHSDLYTEITID